MANQGRNRLTLNSEGLVPVEEDILIEAAVYDALLPCRKFDIVFKVAVLGDVGPGLEFLLRLVKAIPGISEEDVAAFFGYNANEVAYVLREAIGPAYIEREEGQLWLTNAGEALFKDSDEPLIYSVEKRRRTFGFDLLSVAPERPRSLDRVELALPELPLPKEAATGSASTRVQDRFRRFFLELADRSDREEIERRDLYSTDEVSPGERFQVPVRVRTFVRASSPSLVEDLDLTSWRRDHELTERGPVEHAASELVDRVSVTANQLRVAEGFEELLSIAPDFLKDFRLRDGFSASRFWRAAVSRAGEPRRDRPTIPLAGSFVTNRNIHRIRSLIEYGLERAVAPPTHAFLVAPQVPLWAATTLYRDIMAMIRKQAELSGRSGEIKFVCLTGGRPERYIERAFDQVVSAEASVFPPALELLLLPGAVAAAAVHSPLGAASGFPVPLGIGSFDNETVYRVQKVVRDALPRFSLSEEMFGSLARSLAEPAATDS